MGQQLYRIAEWNNRDMRILKGQLIHSQAVDQQKNGSIKALFNKQHFRSSIQILLTTFCATCAYFGVALFQLSFFEERDRSFDNIFWELLVCTSSEIPGMILGVLIFDHVGRIPFLTSTFFVSCVCFIGLVFSPEFVGVALIFLARMCVSTAYNILIVYILEYYPTTIRSTALGFSITLARFAGISTSFIVQDLSTSNCSVIFAISCFVAAICTFLLPTETLGRELTDDSDEGLEELVNATLTEYDQSTMRLMQHKPASFIRRQVNRRYQKFENTELCQPNGSNKIRSIQ